MLDTGSVVTIRHYSMINVFKCVVTETNGGRVEVKLPKECQKSTFLAGDPLVVAFESENSTEIKGCRIEEYRRDKELLIYSEDEFDEGASMRSHDRFPVSLYADYRVVEGMSSKKGFALVKDISDYGLLVYSKDSHFKGMSLNFDIYLTRDILSLTAEIVRKVEYDGYYEYGLKIRHNGPFVFNHIKNYVTKAQNELIAKFTKE